VLHDGGRQRTSARPLWQAMIAGKAGVTGSPDPSGAEAEAEAYFGAKAPKPTLAQPDQSSLLLVRSHAIMDGKLGQILDQLLGSGFAVGNLQMMQLSRPNAQEFLEVFKGVV
jgi:nucleoside-diphosphate kinase